jgi:hypothetical protein
MADHHERMRVLGGTVIAVRAPMPSLFVSSSFRHRIAALGSLVMAGCTGSNAAETAALRNYESCDRWVTAASSAPCVGPPKPTSEQFCEPLRQSAGCDVSGYYDCLAAGTRCIDVGGRSTLDPDALRKCSPPPCVRTPGGDAAADGG